MIVEEKTCYKNLKFDQRLEARWGVFMDAFSWNWEYRRIRRDIDPFFVLHGVTINASPNHIEWILKDQDVCLLISPDYSEGNVAEARILSDLGTHVLTLGKIPDGFSEREILDDLKNMALGYGERTYDFYPARDSIPAKGTHCLLWADERGAPIVSPWHAHQGVGNGDITKTLEAFKQARQARFEWGQSGYINH